MQVGIFLLLLQVCLIPSKRCSVVLQMTWKKVVDGWIGGLVDRDGPKRVLFFCKKDCHGLKLRDFYKKVFFLFGRNRLVLS